MSCHLLKTTSTHCSILSKAFDSIAHNIFFKKLNLYGIRGIALEWFRNYFTNRSQFVSYRDAHSANCSVTCGVPHGSVLAPLLFIIYTNDLPHSRTYSNCILFADDTTIYCTSNNKTTVQGNIENDMKSLAGWFYANKLSLNIQKNNFLVFSPKNMDNVMTAIKLGNQQILQVRNTKFLGIYIDDGLEWGDRINHITKKIASGADVLQAVNQYILKIY